MKLHELTTFLSRLEDQGFYDYKVMATFDGGCATVDITEVVSIDFKNKLLKLDLGS